MCQIRLNLTIKTSEQCQWHRSSVFIIADIKHISQLVSIVESEQVNAK